MHLARTVTHSTVAECKRRMSWSEFLDWQALYRIMPWGDDWQQAGTIAFAAAAPHVKKRLKPEDFIPARKRIHMRPRQTPQQMKAILFGGTQKLREWSGGR